MHKIKRTTQESGFLCYFSGHIMPGATVIFKIELLEMVE